MEGQLLTVSSMEEGTKEFSGVSLIRALILLIRAELSRPSTSQRPVHHIGGQISSHEFCGDTSIQSIADTFSLFTCSSFCGCTGLVLMRPHLLSLLGYQSYQLQRIGLPRRWWFSGLVTKSCSTLATPGTAACQAPLSMGFSRQEQWSGLPFSWWC